MAGKNDADAFTKKVNEIAALLDVLKENRGDADAHEEIHKQLNEYQSFLNENYLFIEGKYSSYPCLRVDYYSAFLAGVESTRRKIKSDKKHI